MRVYPLGAHTAIRFWPLPKRGSDAAQLMALYYRWWTISASVYHLKLGPLTVFWWRDLEDGGPWRPLKWIGFGVSLLNRTVEWVYERHA